MPEGDTLHRTAARLRPVLVGEALERFEAPRLSGPFPRPGETVGSVEVVGKHLFVAFSGGLTLHTHLRMTGSWHLYPSGGPWRKPAHLRRCVVGVAGWDAVCFSAPVVALLPTAEVRGHGGPVAHLGPDLTAVAPDELAAALDVCGGRMALLADGDTLLGDALADQRVACGVGNVYVSEVCWHEQVSPFAPVAAVDPATRRRLLATASRLLRANLTTARRTTVPGGLAVYGRAGEPCRRCGAAVRRAPRGPDARTTYWCPVCQPVPAGAGG